MPKTKYKISSNKISLQNIDDILNSIINAYDKKTPLNRFLTINLQDICPDKPKGILRSLLDNYRKFCERNGIEPSYLQILENNHGDNLHAHILLHIPPSQENRWANKFKMKLKAKWLENSNHSVTKIPNWFDLQTIQYGNELNKVDLLNTFAAMRAVYKSPSADIEKKIETIINTEQKFNNEARQFKDICRLTAYLLKGLYKNQGKITGRRCSRSHSLIYKNSF